LTSLTVLAVEAAQGVGDCVHRVFLHM
jgi:hypothetical protein